MGHQLKFGSIGIFTGFKISIFTGIFLAGGRILEIWPDWHIYGFQNQHIYGFFFGGEKKFGPIGVTGSFLFVGIFCAPVEIWLDWHFMGSTTFVQYPLKNLFDRFFYERLFTGSNSFGRQEIWPD